MKEKELFSGRFCYQGTSERHDIADLADERGSNLIKSQSRILHSSFNLINCKTTENNYFHFVGPRETASFLRVLPQKG